MSGIVYCVINDSIGHDLQQTGKIQFFKGSGRHEQSFYEGCLISAVVSLTGVILVVIAVSG
jgi:hypothetical protein